MTCVGSVGGWRSLYQPTYVHTHVYMYLAKPVGPYLNSHEPSRLLFSLQQGPTWGRGGGQHALAPALPAHGAHRTGWGRRASDDMLGTPPYTSFFWFNLFLPRNRTAPPAPKAGISASPSLDTCLRRSTACSPLSRLSHRLLFVPNSGLSSGSRALMISW